MLALGAVGLVTALIGVTAADARIGNVSILYLPSVLIVAVRLGRGPAIVASVASFFLYDFFFIEPRYQLTVGDAEGWVTLLLLLLTAAVTGQLTADQRARARIAEEREREAVVLYDVARLTADPDLDVALHAIAQRIRAELGVDAVAIELAGDAGRPRWTIAGASDAEGSLRAAAASSALGPGPMPSSVRRGEPGRWVRLVHPSERRQQLAANVAAVPVLSGDTRIGSILLLLEPATRFSPSDDRLLSAVATQLGIARERARLRHEASEAEALRRADELKDALLDAVSHDLRTPLASILAAASSLHQRDVTWTAGERDEFLSAIEGEARRLDRLVGNLLDLSRIDAGRLRPQKSWYDPGALVDDVVARLRSVTAGHPVTTQVPDDLPPVPLDYVEIDQVLSNLIENAARYSPSGTEISIGVERGDSAVVFRVRDHGPGITSEAERELFTPFQPVMHADRRNGSGIGLGLAVSRRLVEAHGGRIWLERPVDGGSCFTFRLPVDGVPAT